MGVTLLPIFRIFFRHLSKIGVDCICLPPHFKCWGDVPQCVAVWLLVGRYRLCQGECMGEAAEAHEGVAILRRGGASRCRWYLAKSCEKPLEVGFAPPEAPRVVVDLSLWHEHTPGEKHELVEQVLETLRVVRRFLWDGALLISNAPGEFLQLLDLHARGLVHKMNILGGAPVFENPVVLDPEGPCLFTEEVAYSHKEFVIGGIVDKERTAKSGTKRLAELLGVEKRCRIELRGSRVGVPDRINKIAEIILRTLAGSSLEEAILATQAKRDRVYRLMWEIQKRARRAPDGSLVITRAELAEANWMGAPPSEVELALKKTQAVVV
ncbi:MAG: tRNA (adenine(9)-N1)-methyltransferase Trm10 [Pyrobaculum sp.]